MPLRGFYPRTAIRNPPKKKVQRGACGAGRRESLLRWKYQWMWAQQLGVWRRKGPEWLKGWRGPGGARSKAVGEKEANPNLACFRPNIGFSYPGGGVGAQQHQNVRSLLHSICVRYNCHLLDGIEDSDLEKPCRGPHNSSGAPVPTRHSYEQLSGPINLLLVY